RTRNGPARADNEGGDSSRLRELAVLHQPLRDRAVLRIVDQDVRSAVAVEVARTGNGPARTDSEGGDSFRLRELAVLHQPLPNRAVVSIIDQDVRSAVAVEVARTGNGPA